MAGRRKKVEVEQVEVIGSTLEENKKVCESEGEMIAIACCLPFGLKFDDVPAKNGGTKVVTFPSINEGLRGKKTGVLALAGNAVCVRIPKADWDAIVAIHGREDAFIGRNGGMPCLYPVGDEKGFKSARSEIAEMKHGLEPVTPESAKVVERKDE